MQTKITPTVTKQLLIQRPIEEVFQLMIDAERISSLWLANSQGPIQEGADYTWVWPELGESMTINVIKIIPYQLISTVWQDTQLTIDYEFVGVTPETTYVTIKAYNFKETGEKLVRAITDQDSMLKIALHELELYLTESTPAITI